MDLHSSTPLIESSILSVLAGCKVFLKLENSQPVGSFKIRGIGHLCRQAKYEGKTKIICSSGGNAGLAAAYACRKLGMTCKIFVPQTTPLFMRKRLLAERADVIVVGEIWDEANAAALECLESEPTASFVHPYDHPLIWNGHASMVHEIKAQFGAETKPGCIVASVGGGGLVTGIVEGLVSVGWHDVPVVAVETKGADSLAACVAADAVVTIPTITSIAKSLGSRTICQQLFQYTKEHPIISVVLPDKEAISACLNFANDHRMIVEPACGVSLAVIYDGIIKVLQLEGKLPSELDNIIVIVCGGNCVTMDTLNDLKANIA